LEQRLEKVEQISELGIEPKQLSIISEPLVEPSTELPSSLPDELQLSTELQLNTEQLAKRIGSTKGRQLKPYGDWVLANKLKKW
jgi:hypothetical protein